MSLAEFQPRVLIGAASLLAAFFLTPYPVHAQVTPGKPIPNTNVEVNAIPGTTRDTLGQTGASGARRDDAAPLNGQLAVFVVAPVTRQFIRKGTTGNGQKRQSQQSLADVPTNHSRMGQN